MRVHQYVPEQSLIRLVTGFCKCFVVLWQKPLFDCLLECAFQPGHSIGIKKCRTMLGRHMLVDSGMLTG